MKKKITIIIEDLRVGGPQKQLVYFINSIKNFNKYDLNFFIPNDNNAFFKNEILKKVKISHFPFSIPSKKNVLKYFFFFLFELTYLVFQLKKNKTEIVYVAGGTSNFKSIIAAKLLKLKIIWHIHDCNTNFLIKRIFYLLFCEKIQFIFASKKSKNYYLSNKRTKKWKVLRSAVKVGLNKKKLKKIDKSFNIGMVANINPDKNIELFIRIVEKNLNKKIQFHLFGNVWKSQNSYYNFLLKKYNKSFNNFNWYKKIFNNYEIYKKIDLLICTSKTESFPLSFSEALSYSIPIITTDVGDVKEFFKSKKKFAYVVQGNNPKQFLNIINYLFKNKKIFYENRLNAKKFAFDNLNIKNFSKEMFDIFN